MLCFVLDYRSGRERCIHLFDLHGKPWLVDVSGRSRRATKEARQLTLIACGPTEIQAEGKSRLPDGR